MELDGDFAERFDLGPVDDQEAERAFRDAGKQRAPDLRATAEATAQPIPQTDKIKNYGLLYDDILPETKTVDQAITWSLKYNGKTFDRERNNTEQVIAPMNRYYGGGIEYMAAVTNYNAKGAYFFVYYPTAILATTQIVIGLDTVDPASGVWQTFFVSANLVPAAFPYILKIYPGLNTNPGFTSNDRLPRKVRLYIAKPGAGADYYDVSIGANLLL